MTYSSKDILIEIDDSTWSGSVPKNLKGKSGPLSFDMLEVLIHIGLATRHPEQVGISVNDFWAFLRYLNCFSEGSDFRLNEKWQDVDPHQKTILSDDFGMGFASYYLTKQLNLISFVDTGYFLKHIPSLLINNRSKRGPSKTPDFILLDSSFEMHLLECKGTQSSIKNLNKQIDSGLPQKRNIRDPKGIINEKLVTGIFIPQYNSSTDAIFRVIDPEFTLDFNEVEKEELIIRALQGQFSKELQMLNLTKFGNDVANEDNLEEVKIDNVVELITNKQEIIYEQHILDNDEEIKWTVGYDLEFLKAMQEKGVDNLLQLFKEMYRGKSNLINVSYTNTNWERKNSSYKSIFGLEMKAEIKSLN